MGMGKSQEICLLCNNELVREKKYPVKKGYKNILGFKKIKFCNHCQLGIAFPRKTQKELDQYYDSGKYWQKTVNENIYLSMHEKNQAEWRIKKCLPYISSFSEKINVLDIGAGHGWIVYWLNKYCKDKIFGIDLIEPDHKLLKNISISDYSFAVNKISNINTNLKKYDLVFLNHVFEHSADPYYFINKTISTVNSGGLVYVEVPHDDWKYKNSVFPHTIFFTDNALTVFGKKLNINTLICNSFGRSRVKSNRVKKIYNRIYTILFSLGAKFCCYRLCSYADSHLWKYNKSNNDGIWLQWIFKC